MRYLILTVALLIGVVPETVQAQIGGRATHGSHGGTRNFQISMPQLRLLIREVVREVVRETHTSRAGATSRSTKKTIDQLTSAVERHRLCGPLCDWFETALKVVDCVVVKEVAIPNQQAVVSASHGNVMNFSLATAKASGAKQRKIGANIPSAPSNLPC